MTLPVFYDPARVGTLYAPDVSGATRAGSALGLPAASQDERRVLLVLVDAQVDFVHTDGALSVPGAVDDARRTIEWIYRNVDRLTSIAASLDSHIPIQIFFPTWWADRDGNHPAPFTPITSDDVEQGIWRPLYEPDWSADYTRRLEADARKTLMIWPYHTLLGTPGHAITPALYEAMAFHSAARQAQPEILTKGSIPQTEHYSMLEAEVKVPDDPRSHLNTAFLDRLSAYDEIYIAGQARSHCVLETVNSIMNAFAGQPSLIGRLRVLEDAMSSVAHPEIDFDALADAAFQRHAASGLRLVRTTD